MATIRSTRSTESWRGPVSRIAQFKAIEMNLFAPPLILGTMQQIRYPTTRIAYTPELALSRMFSLPGSSYYDPELSWRYSISPAGLGFVKGDGLGPNYNGTLWGGATTTTNITGRRALLQIGGESAKRAVLESAHHALSARMYLTKLTCSAISPFASHLTCP